jgi:transposase
LSREELWALPTVDQAILLSTMRQLTFAEEEIAAIEGGLARRIADVPEVQLLLTITGVGLITAATMAYGQDANAARLRE